MASIDRVVIRACLVGMAAILRLAGGSSASPSRSTRGGQSTWERGVGVPGRGGLDRQFYIVRLPTKWIFFFNI